MSDELILALHSVGAIKFGEFKLKSGIVTPFYLDLRLLISHPRVLRDTACVLSQVLAALSFDRIAAVPYAGLPIGVATALEMDRPLIFPRREKKDHGTGRAIEGEFHAGDQVVVVDDVITKGTSKIEAIEPLIAAGLKVRDIVVLVDREQGGAEELAGRGYRVHSAMNIHQIMKVLKDSNKVSEKQYQDVLASLA